MGSSKKLRIDGRKNDEIRPFEITRNYISHAEGSVFIEVGKTRVVCTATVEDKVPPFLRGKGSGWITAEYDMLPRSVPQRIIRPQVAGKISGRFHEIQRLIGRSLRAVVDLGMIGERTVWIDCDVIEADGGTRTASVNGSFIALYDCLRSLVDRRVIEEMPINNFLSAISVGIVENEVMVDLCFQEDSQAQVDMNVVMDSTGNFVEIQSTAEGGTFTKEQFEEMMTLSVRSLREILEIEKKVLCR
ncbi:MAG: ribonuclease PH [Actinobacteria bacterium]|nr:ribonuclease PH [Actinomycetota bacterium]